MQRLKLRGVKQTSRGDTVYQVTRVDEDDATVADQTVVDFLEFTEMTTPSAAVSNKARLFSRDNGAGKTQICARFATGAVVVVATEP